jgi:hypothetical protein
MTVRELLAKIDSRELTEWAAYYSLEPWGAEVEDWRAGMIASTIANVNRDPKKQRKPYTPKDFMPQRDVPQKEEQTWEEQAEILEMWFRIAGKKG